jgi:hypothetical protein
MTSAGFCLCGCGGRTKRSPQACARSGYARGEYRRYLVGHNLRGETGETHRRWKGEEVGRIAAHLWLLQTSPKTGICERCGKSAKTHHAFKGENGKWSRNREDYLELCPSCHKRFDLAKEAASDGQ